MRKKYLSMMNMISQCIQYVIAATLIFMVALMFVEVVRRYLFGHQFAWSEELIRYLAVWVAFLGGAAAYKEKQLVCFDLLSSKFQGKNKMLLELFSNTVVLVFLTFIFYLSLKNVMSPSIFMQKSVGMKVTMAFPYAAIPVGTGLMVIFTLNNYMDIIGKYFGGKDEVSEEVAQ